MDARGGDTVELHEADKPWAALMIPHNGGDTQRDNRFIKPHARSDTAKHTKGAKQTMSAYTPCALRFYEPLLTHESGSAGARHAVAGSHLNAKVASRFGVRGGTGHEIKICACRR